MIRDAFDAGVEPGGLHSNHEIKILVCYMLAGAQQPLPREAVLEILCSNGMANFFDVSAAIDELLSLGNLSEPVENMVTVTDTGREIAATLETMIPYTLRERSVNAALQLLSRRRNERENHVKITPKGNGFVVTCCVGSEEDALFSFSLSVGTETQAQMIREQFLNDPQLLYQSVIALLTEKTSRVSDKQLTIRLE